MNRNDIAESIDDLKNELEKCDSKDQMLNIDLINYCRKHNIEYNDKRQKGGCLWIVGGHELESLMNLLKKYNINFMFSEHGGRASRHRQAWYFK